MSKESYAATDRFTGADVGVLLGSGLGDVSDGFEVEASVPFPKVPGLGDAAVAGHRGVIKRARLGDRTCVLIEGRRHVYEAEKSVSPPDRIRTLIEFLADSGVRHLIITSACGSLDPALPPGRLVLVRDVLDLQMRRPWNGRRDDTSRGLPVDTRLSERLETAAKEARVPLGRGVMACNAGPAYETAAEITALRRMGASVVTMSGAPEIGHCRDIGIRVASLALVTNWATGISTGPLTHGEVLAAAAGAAGDLRRIIELFLYF